MTSESRPQPGFTPVDRWFDNLFAQCERYGRVFAGCFRRIASIVAVSRIVGQYSYQTLAPSAQSRRGPGYGCEFAGSFQTGAPPTQGRVGAQSKRVATENLHHAILVALTPNAEFTLKLCVEMSPAERTYSNIHPRLHCGWIALVSHRLRIRPHTALSATVWRNFDRMLPKCIPLRVKDARATYAEQEKNGTVQALRRSRFRALLTVAANRSVKGEQPKVPFFYEDS